MKELTYDLIQLNFRKGKGSLVAIDDVKVWEALPLDAPDYKEEKTAEAKDEKPDEAKPAEAEKPKEKKPAVELSNALGKDTEGNPILWDFSEKGVMRGVRGGKLSKVTIYGPGQMTARIKAQMLVIMGKGEVEITAGGATQTVTLPGKADIKSGDIITLKAKRGMVQITDITAEGKP
ncbi:MAG: hypothetical protein GXP25_00705 [Planctomycetes bacterium]|nr:hypothetical protein [Planctomycetota bacterium]